MISGGLFILHGLITAVKEKIDPFLGNILNYLIAAMTLTANTDEMGARVSCGLVTDLFSSSRHASTPHVPKIMPALLHVLKSQDIET